MSLRNWLKKRCNYFILFSLILIHSFSAISQTNDSLDFKADILYFIEKYKVCSPDYKRGLTEEEWTAYVNTLLDKVSNAKSKKEYLYALRYFSPLIKDYHCRFPDGGFYNRNKIWSSEDALFPVWTKSTLDKRLICVKDYSHTIAPGDEILFINGHPSESYSPIITI